MAKKIDKDFIEALKELMEDTSDRLKSDLQAIDNHKRNIEYFENEVSRRRRSINILHNLLEKAKKGEV